MEKKLEDAVRCWKRWIEHSPDYEAYQRLAALYKAQGDDKKRLETLAAFLDQPDHGLGHALVRVELANHHMSKGDYKTARPFADAAAETGAEWAMRCALRCAEGEGDKERAAAWAERIRQRYGR